MFQLGDLSSVLLRNVSDNETNRLLSSGLGVALTSELCLPGHFDRQAATEIASDLCAVLSLAEGTLINWIYSEQRRSSDGTMARGFYHPAVTRRYNGALPLIDPKQDSELVAFVQHVYRSYASKKEEYSLAAIARAISAIRTTGFLDTRCLQLLSLIECIVSRDAEIHKTSHLIDDDLFSARIVSLSSRVREVLRSTFPEASDSELDAMCSHLRGFNYPPFRKGLLVTAKRHGSSIDKTEIQRLSDTRNELVHRGRFATKVPFEEVCLVMSVLDRLVMGVLEYAGPYIDVRTFKRSKP